MRDAKGRILKGARISVSTEIKKGERISPVTEIKKGQRLSPTTEFKVGSTVGMKARFQKGQPSAWKGKSPSAEARMKMRLAKLGPKSHRWRGGISTEYQRWLASKHWKHIRTRILERDNHRCMVCGAPADAVDHIIPWRVSENNADSNLQAICAPCNTRKMISDLSLRIAVVSGNSRGIGAAITAELRAKGIFVYDISRSTGYDLSTQHGIRKMGKWLEKADIFVHNCGGGGRFGTTEEVFNKNIAAMTAGIENALPGMQHRNWGRVIAIGSIFSKEYGARPIFMAAKAAQAGYMKALSKNPDYVRRGITFNVVAPGNVHVDGKPDVDESALPMGRMGTPQEVAKLVAFLCSNDAAWINGSTIVIDGGESHAI